MISQIVAGISKKPVFGQLGMIYAMLSIGLLGFIVWAFSLKDFMVGPLLRNKHYKNSAICWNNHKNLGSENFCKVFSITKATKNINLDQSARHPFFKSLEQLFLKKKNRRSSETIRRASQNLFFRLFSSNRKLSNFSMPIFDFSEFELLFFKLFSHKFHNYAFLEHFLGFSEGDGSFIVTGNRCMFTITQKDPDFLYGLQKELGFGSVLKDNKNPGIFRYTVTAKKQIRLLIMLFNGNLLLTKTQIRFELWVNHYNSIKEKTENPIILKKSAWDQFILKDGLYKTGWFSGFIDAGGCFNCTVVNSGNFFKSNICFSTLPKITFRFILDQKDERPLLDYIKLSFGGVGSIQERKSRTIIASGISYGSASRYVTQTEKTCKQIIQYLDEYPLRAKKRIAFLRWKKLYNLIYNEMIKEQLKNNLVLSQKRLAKIEELVKNINSGKSLGYNSEDEEIVQAPRK